MHDIVSITRALDFAARKRLQVAHQLGGAERVKRHKDGGKLTVRERIDRLLDPGSFREVGSIAGIMPTGLMTEARR